MKNFKDNAGRTWTVSVDVATIKRVRSLLDVDLMAAVDGKLFERLVSDPVLLCDVIYVVCKPEADAQNVSDEDFGRAMAGDAVDHATTALLEELVDFFPQARRRLLAKALSKLKTLEARAMDVADKKLDSPELEAELEAILAKIDEEPEPSEPGDSSGILPASSASTPAP